jgi:methylthioribose-1-phosphate isomerase
MNSTTHLLVQALEWNGDYLKVLDQRQLPENIVYHSYTDAIGVVEAIKTMQVRGAPAIGIAAAYGVVLSAKRRYAEHHSNWREQVLVDIRHLSESRPTAVNLFWALELMQKTLMQQTDNPIPALQALAEKIHADDIAANHRMGKLGADILGNCKGVMTHCNAGALATGGYGTALGVIRSAYKRGLRKIYAGETRPWLQGARLTVWELAQDGIPTTLIADSAAAWLMAQGEIDWIIVGADRIAANGDVANKIGTYSLAVLAKQHNVKMMVVAPTSSLDSTMASGAEIQIEQRLQSELLPSCYQTENSLVNAWNPVFDVTPAHLISAIVTEKGVILKPAEQGGIRSLLC